MEHFGRNTGIVQHIRCKQESRRRGCSEVDYNIQLMQDVYTPIQWGVAIGIVSFLLIIVVWIALSADGDSALPETQPPTENEQPKEAALAEPITATPIIETRDGNLIAWSCPICSGDLPPSTVEQLRHGKTTTCPFCGVTLTKEG
jgi:hypothetical protein